MNRRIKLLLAIILVAAGIALLFVKTSREYINLQPTEGELSGVILRAGQIYEQTFISRRSTISSLSVFLRPAQVNVPDGNVTLTLKRDDQTIAQGTISSTFIDANGASQVRFNPPVTTAPGQALTLRVSVPPKLDQALRLQQRLLDETFDSTNVSFTINRTKQANPAAYQIYHRYRPPLSLHLGGLLILTGIATVIPSLPIYALGAALLFSIPATSPEQMSLLLFVYAAGALTGMILLLRTDKIAFIPSLFGAHVFAFTSWFPLHAQAGRELYAFVALLPLLFILITKRQKLVPRRKKQLMLAAALLAVLIFALASQTSSGSITQTANIRDVFFDPNQVAAAQKVQGASWDNFGSYIGPISGALALIGLIWQGRRRKIIFLIGVLGALLALTPLGSALTGLLPLPPPHFIILTTFALAYFAAWGLHGLQKFLQSDQHSRGKLIPIIIALITLIALLDLWQVAVGTLEYSLL